MEKYIPFEKLSKRKQRELNQKKRGSWHGLNPVTRKPKDPKAYDRRKAPRWTDDPGGVFCGPLAKISKILPIFGPHPAGDSQDL